MALNKIVLGDYIENSTKNNKDLKYGKELIVGVSNKGCFAEPNVSVDNVDLTPYKIVNNGAFVYNPSRLNVGSIAYRTEGLCLVSHLYVVFYLNEKGLREIDPDFLYMYLHRSEFYREVDFRNYGSQRPEFGFHKLVEVEMPLPPMEIQKRYVAVYKAMIANQAAYEKGLDDLKLVCDAYIEDLRRKHPCEEIGPYIEEINIKNDGVNKVDLLKGFNKEGDFIEPQRVSADLQGLKIIDNGQLIYNRATECVTDKFIVAMRKGKKCAVSNSYVVFTSRDETKLLNKYLLMWLSRREFARYSRFKAFGTAHEYFEYRQLEEVSIPIPNITIQQCIAEILSVYMKRKEINEKLKSQIKDLCPILIAGAINEAKKEA